MGQCLGDRPMAGSPLLPLAVIVIGVLLPLLSGCGVKGSPKPPLSRDPERVRGLTLRQSGPMIELTWSRSERRENGAPIGSPVTYKVLARAVERGAAPPAPGSTPATKPGTAPPAGGVPPAATGTPPPAGANPGGGGTPGAPEGAIASGGAAPATGGSSPSAAGSPVAGPGGAGAVIAGPGGPAGSRESARAEEESFLKTAVVVAEVADVEGTAKPSGPAEGTRAGAPSRGPDFNVSLGPERFPGVRFTAARLALAVVAEDARGRRSHPQPILQIDPVAPLPPPEEFKAAGTPEGVQLSWRRPSAVAIPFAVNVYRVELAGGEDMPPGFPPAPMPGSPFPGDSTIDRTARMSAAYAYEARLVAMSPGAGLRESVPAGPARIEYADRFPPGPPTLVTVDSVPEDAVRLSFSTRVAWSSPIDRDVGGFRIYRAKGDGPFVLAGQVDAAQNEWVNAHLSEGTYHYYVTAIDTAQPPNESEKSETVDVVLG